MEPLYARYPFLEMARAAVEAAEIDLAEVVTADRSPVIDRAVERVEGAVRLGRVPDPVSDHRLELLSYPVARVLVSLVDEPVLIDRYALAEASRAFDLLAEDLQETADLRSSSHDLLTLDDLLADFGLEDAVEQRSDDYVIAVTAYLSFTSDLQEEEWRLVNRSLASGEVPISRDELDVLLREAIRERVRDGLPLHVPDVIASALDDEVAAIERSLTDVSVPTTIDTVVPELFPPCMSALIDRLRSEADLSDLERFTVVSFLAAIGMDEDDLVSFLETDTASGEGRLRYQVEHVHGGTRSTAYPPPSCETLQSVGACIQDDERCEPADHPLAEYARRLDGAEQVTDWREPA